MGGGQDDPSLYPPEVLVIFLLQNDIMEDMGAAVHRDTILRRLEAARIRCEAARGGPPASRGGWGAYGGGGGGRRGLGPWRQRLGCAQLAPVGATA